jgi:starvation-inducible DNA-binding protein
MEQLVAQLKILLANNIALGFKAQGYHWNVESDDFYQFHEFFGEIYEDFHGATDEYAEWIRMMKSYAPYRLTDFFDIATIGEPVIVGDPKEMIIDLYNEMEKHTEDLKDLIDIADALRENGLVDFLAARQTSSQKWCWQLGSHMEEDY